MSAIYDIFIYLIALPLKWVLSLFNSKLKEREREWRKSMKVLDSLPPDSQRVWFHASSMGEYEQAKPVIEHLKRANKNLTIICSFYSPSGFKTQSNYPFADAILYMPFDTIANARYFIESVRPDLAVFVRYDAWRNHLLELKSHAVPIILINATEPKATFWNNLSFVKSFYKSNYSLFDEIFTVGQFHTDYFKHLGTQSKIITSADTRFDRIMEKVESVRNEKIIPQQLFTDDNILVAGSIWKADFEIIRDAVALINSSSADKISVIYVPHEPTDSFISELKNRLANAIILSDLLNKIDNNIDIKIPSGGAVIVDSIGKLLKLYGNATFAYIGGAFGAGVHSLTEPAGYGIPLACGKNCFNSPDAKGLIDAEALTPISNAAELEEWLKTMISDKSKSTKTGKAAYDYINQSKGASAAIADEIQRRLSDS